MNKLDVGWRSELSRKAIEKSILFEVFDDEGVIEMICDWVPDQCKYVARNRLSQADGANIRWAMFLEVDML